MTETLLLKNNSIELQICTVHKTKLNMKLTLVVSACILATSHFH